MDTRYVRFRRERATLLATLYGRAKDSWSPDPILNDRTAAELVDELDYDFAQTGMTPGIAAGVAIRAKQLDAWIKAYLADVPEATVLHLGCGLDSRVRRIDPGAGVRWYDVDYPDVIEFRRQFFTECPGYRMIGASVLDSDWLANVNNDDPTIVVAEGLSMYLPKRDGQRLLYRLTRHFPCGQLVFDAYSLAGVRLQQRYNRAVRQAGATLYWGLNDPKELELCARRLVCVTAMSGFDAIGREKLPLPTRLASRIPAVRQLSWLLRYRF